MEQFIDHELEIESLQSEYQRALSAAILPVFMRIYAGS